jgi:FKBP-type peptidyl-prolyl cis-trans isomerase 2
VALLTLTLLLAACSESSSTPTVAATSVSDDRVAKDGDTVAVDYHGTLDDGEVFDSSRDREPLIFTVGAGQVIPGFDEAVRGLMVGESVTARMEPEDAYGERSDEMILEFPVSQLPEGLTVGGSVFFQNGAQGVILEITGETFQVDANHSLAGKALTFEIELVSIQ